MTTKTFWMVRHRPTGRLLPARTLATHYGFDRDDTEPRLFATERAAKNCATCWVRGRWHKEIRTESEGWEYPSYEYLAEPTPSRVEGRNDGDLEVIRAELSFPEPR